MSKNRSLITRIVRSCRAELENISPWLNSGGRRNSNVVKHLGGYCGYGAVLMWSRLKDAGLKPQVVSGHGHCFAKVDGLLVDVTASQFGQAKVVVRDYKKVQEMANSGEYQMNWWKENQIGETPCDLGWCRNLKEIRDARTHQEKGPTPNHCGTC